MNGNTPYKLQQVQVPIVNNAQCHEIYTHAGATKAVTNRIANNSVLCAGYTEGEGVCLGDSGAPLMQPIFENGEFLYYQIGIVSYQLGGCARKHIPALYTSIQYNADWIKQQIQY